MKEIQIAAIFTLAFAAVSFVGVAAIWRLLSKRFDNREMGFARLVVEKSRFVGGQVTHSFHSGSELVGELADIELVHERSDGEPELKVSFAWSVKRMADGTLKNFTEGGRVRILWPCKALVLDRCKFENRHRVLVIPHGVQGHLVFNRSDQPRLSRESALGATVAR